MSRRRKDGMIDHASREYPLPACQRHLGRVVPVGTIVYADEALTLPLLRVPDRQA